MIFWSAKNVKTRYALNSKPLEKHLAKNPSYFKIPGIFMIYFVWGFYIILLKVNCVVGNLMISTLVEHFKL